MLHRALITGISGQDGSYLAEFLLDKGYEVHGLVRPNELNDPSLLPDCLMRAQDRLHLHGGLLESDVSIWRAVSVARPHECYHLAGPSFVRASFEEEPLTLNAIVGGTHNLLHAVREFSPQCRVFVAGSSEMFGEARASPQNENTEFSSRSIYGLAKVLCFNILRYFRERHGTFACLGYLYNHESPRRAPEFLPRKVSIGAAQIALGKKDNLSLGNLDAERDWGYAPEYVEAMWMMLQADEPVDHVIATGSTHTVRELVEIAFSHVGLDYRNYVTEDPRFFSQKEKVRLVGDPSHIGSRLGWKARLPFKQIIREMVTADLESIRSRKGVAIS